MVKNNTLRINQFLAQCGLGSRRHVEDLVLKGRITVNGQPCKKLSTQVDPNRDDVLLDGKLLRLPRERIFIMMNQPTGYVVTASDEFGRKTVFDLLPKFPAPIHAIGRLDKDTEGLLLFTSEGDLTQKLLHPSRKVEKTYKVTCAGRIDREQLEALRKGVKLSDGPTQPARVFIKMRDDNHTVLRFTITEGRNRQVRRMIEAVGSSVTSLKRLQVGPIKLDRLPVGMWRPLMPREVSNCWPSAKGQKMRMVSSGSPIAASPPYSTHSRGWRWKPCPTPP
jgi:23S rRNA pseudouridine2605 synthase